MQLRRYGFSFMKIRDIFISHIHGDHIFGIYGLLSTMSMIGRTADLFIYAPESFGDILKTFIRDFGDMFLFKVNHIKISGDSPTLIMETKGTEVYSFPLNHRVSCYGYLFKEKMPLRNVHKYMIEKEALSLAEIARLKEGEDIVREDGTLLRFEEITYIPYQPRSFAYCSDTAPFDKLKDYVAGVDLMYHEATFANDLEKMARQTLHSTAKDAALCARNASAGRLLIGHFSSRYKDTTILLNEARRVFPETYEAEQGKEFEIPLKKLNINK